MSTGALPGTPTFSRVAAASAIAVGVTVLVGWALDIGILKSMLPGLVAMKVNTAIALILAGLSLWTSAGTPSQRASRLSAACAVAVGAIGLLTLGEYVTGWNLGIDELFVTVRPSAQEPFGGRMAGNTALTFGLLAVQLGRVGARFRRPWLDEGCTLAAALVASIAILGYVFDSVPLTRLASNSQMAVHTAMAFLVLCAGVLARDGDGPLVTIATAEGPGSRLVRRLLPGMMAALLMLTWLQLRGRQAGLFDDGFGLAVMAVLTIVAGGAATFWSAATLNREEAHTRWLTSAVGQTPASVFITELDGTIRYVNNTFAEITGYTAAEAIGRKASMLKSGLTPQETYRELWDTILSGQTWRGEFQNRRKNGDLYWDAVMISPIRDARGVVTHLLAVQTDITAQRRALTTIADSARLSHLSSDVGIALGREPELRAALRGCTEAIVEHLEAAFARIWTLDATGEVLELQASAGLYTRLDGSHARVRVGEKKIGKIAAERLPHLTNAVVGDDRVSEQEWARREGMVSFAGYPLLVGGQLVGVVAMFARHPLNDAVLQALKFVADVIAVGIRRRQTEEDLRASEERYRLLFESNPHPMWVVDVKTYCFLAVNAAAVQSYGYSRDEFLAMTARDIRPPDDVALFEQTMTSPREGVRLTGGWRHRKKNGTLIDVEISAHDIAFDNRPAQLVLVTDVTERKRSEAALRESQERFRQMAEHIQEVFFLLELQTSRALFVSPAFEQLWGVTRTALYERGELWFEGVHPEDRPAVTDALAQGRANKVVEVAFRVVRPDGSMRWVRAHAYPVPDADRLVGSVEDITERKAAEDALLLSERRLRTMFDTVNLIVLGLDADANVAYANPFLEQLTGYSHGEMIGAAWFERFVPTANRPPWRGVFLELLEHDFHTHYENPIVTKAGKERLISWHNTVVRDAQGKATGTLSVGEDITDRSVLELQLHQAQKMEAVGRLAGGVAHDFNNLLTVILGEVELMQLELPPPQEINQALLEIRNAGERAVGLTRQLLAFSRRQLVEPTIFRVNDLVTEMGKMLQRLIGEDLELVLRVAPDPGAVKADRGQVEQVLVNLAVNARDAMPDGGTLTIETQEIQLDEDYAREHAGVTPGDYIALVVSDTGTGMTPEVQARIFEPFFTTKEPGKGTGLGLATCYGIVKQAGGHLAVYSEVGHGATFKVYLPLVRAAPLEEAVMESPVPRGTETILLVEDDGGVRGVALRVLEGQGYTVLQASNGGAALRLLQAHGDGVDLLLTDVVMPEMGGRELAERVEARIPTIKVLYATGYTDDVVLQHRLIAHDVRMIQKPYTRETLGRKVRAVLDGRPGQ
jgi:PAS domain S-box-containing protein